MQGMVYGGFVSGTERDQQEVPEEAVAFVIEPAVWWRFTLGGGGGVLFFMSWVVVVAGIQADCSFGLFLLVLLFLGD